VPEGRVQAVVPSEGRAAGYIQVEEAGRVVGAASWCPRGKSVGTGRVRRGR